MSIDTLNLVELKALAEAATGDRWAVTSDTQQAAELTRVYLSSPTGRLKPLAQTSIVDGWGLLQAHNNAKHIAAFCPAVALQLIARIENLEACLASFLVEGSKAASILADWQKGYPEDEMDEAPRDVLQALARLLRMEGVDDEGSWDLQDPAPEKRYRASYWSERGEAALSLAEVDADDNYVTEIFALDTHALNEAVTDGFLVPPRLAYISRTTDADWLEPALAYARSQSMLDE